METWEDVEWMHTVLYSGLGRSFFGEWEGKGRDSGNGSD